MIVDQHLGNGLRVVVERVPGVRTATAGLWFPAGSRDDPAGRGGLAHLLEHLVFKGSTARSARALAEAMDALGGAFNAFTGREQTCFHGRLLGTRLAEGLELLAELVVAPRLDESDLNSERGVVLDELAMIADDPAESADELLGGCLWGAHPLGRPEAGTPETVRVIEVSDLTAFHRAHYGAQGAVLAVAGRADPDRVLAFADRVFGVLPPGPPRARREAPAPRADARLLGRPSEQAHLVLGAPGPAQADPDRWAAALLASILGGSPSSRLFQALREERGICYEVGAAATDYADAGEFAVFLSTAPRLMGQASALACREVVRLAEQGVPAAEMERHRAQFLAALWMGQESTEARMLRLGRLAAAGLPLLLARDLAREFRAVGSRQVRALAQRIGDPRGWAAAFVGPKAKAPDGWAWQPAGPGGGTAPDAASL